MNKKIAPEDIKAWRKFTSSKETIDNKDYYREKYTMDIDGEYQHKTFRFSSKDFFSLTGTIDQDITSK